MLLLLLAPAFAAERALFLGNSFTFANELDQVVLGLLSEGDPAWADGEATRLADGGLTLADHQERAETAGSEWEAALGADGPSWSWVILQDQSQIPGFSATQAEYRASRAAGVALDALAEARGAGTVFFLTWGYRAGDETNPDRFPDFATMQERLAEGYADYQEAAGEDGTPAWIAPVGLAFARAWATEEEAGLDPLSPESRFYQLYAEDGRHPSVFGTYLAACVFYASLSGRSPEGLGAGALGEADAVWAQAIAAATVFDQSLGYTYPWSEAGEPETGAPETGEPDSGAAETGAPEDEEDPAETGGGGGKSEGCACAAGAVRPGLLPGIIACLATLGAWRRRA